MRKLSVTAMAAAILFASCNKDTATNPTAKQPDMAYKITTSNKTSGVNLKTTATGLISWTSGTANPSLIKFEAKQSGTEIEYKSTVNTTIDIMAPVANSFGGFTLPAGTYNEIELKILLSKFGGTPALVLDGQFTLDSLSLPVHLEVSDNIELKTEQHDVTITDNNSYTITTSFDLSDLASGITLTQLLSASISNGKLVISASSNTALYNTILNNLKNKRHHTEVEHHSK